MDTSIFQYDQEAHEWALYEDGYDKGKKDGLQEGMQQGEALRAELTAKIAELEAKINQINQGTVL